jgi:hypothetical protein
MHRENENLLSRFAHEGTQGGHWFDRPGFGKCLPNSPLSTSIVSGAI